MLALQFFLMFSLPPFVVAFACNLIAWYHHSPWPSKTFDTPVKCFEIELPVLVFHVLANKTTN
jgi:hypothetical protein